MQADEKTQRTLLDAQAHDTHIMQLTYRINTAPERAELETLDSKCSALRDRVVAAEITFESLTKELSKAEADVVQVRERSTRNQERLDAGSCSAKEAEALSSELESLAGRQAKLEDLELAAMEKAETAEQSLKSVQSDLAQMQATRAEKAEQLARSVSDLEQERAHIEAERNRIFDELPSDVADLYTDLRSDYGGLAAVPLTGKRCDGCRMELSPSDLGKIAGIPRNTLVRCPECDRILIRTDQSAA